MIAYLKGSVLEKGKDYAIILCGDPSSSATGTGIGYRVQLHERTLMALTKGENVNLYTHQVVREDSQELFGFATMRELEFFWRLTTVSGVGPKMAMHLLAVGMIETLSRAIDKGDVEFLSSAQGVGKKTAQRVVLELRGKLIDDDGTMPESEGEVVSALENLGYPRSKAREAVKTLDPNGTTQQKIKAALKVLSR